MSIAYYSSFEQICDSASTSNTENELFMLMEILCLQQMTTSHAIFLPHKNQFYCDYETERAKIKIENKKKCV